MTKSEADRTASRKLIQVKLDAELVRQVDHYAIDRDMNRTEAVERLLRLGLEEGKS